MSAHDDEVYTNTCQTIIEFCNKQFIDHNEIEGFIKFGCMTSAKEQFTNLACLDLLHL